MSAPLNDQAGQEISARDVHPAGTQASSFDRRAFLRGTGVLLVSAGLPISAIANNPIISTETASSSATAVHSAQTLSADKLDSWIALTADGRVKVFFGKMDMGQGVDTAIAQFIADELDVAFARIDVIMGDTELTLNQGGASSATGIERGSIPLRNAAAEARRILFELAANHFNITASELTVLGCTQRFGHHLDRIAKATLHARRRSKITGNERCASARHLGTWPGLLWQKRS